MKWRANIIPIVLVVGTKTQLHLQPLFVPPPESEGMIGRRWVRQGLPQRLRRFLHTFEELWVLCAVKIINFLGLTMGNCCLLWRELHQGEDFFEGFPEQNLKGFANVIEIFSAFRCKSLKKWWNVLIPFRARIYLFNILYFKTIKYLL